MAYEGREVGAQAEEGRREGWRRRAERLERRDGLGAQRLAEVGDSPWVGTWELMSDAGYAAACQ